MEKEMKPLLFLQFRRDASLGHEQQCFTEENMFKDVVFVNALDPSGKIPSFSELSNYRGLVMGGSGEICISDWDAVSRELIMRAAPLVKHAVKEDFPTLGVCFGHQFMAHVLGEEVRADPSQAETGAKLITLTEEGVSAPIFRRVPRTFYATEGHKDSVMRLPNRAVLLASSEKCHIQAYRIGQYVYGIQFHPELDQDGMRFRMELFPSYRGHTPLEELLAGYMPTPEARSIVQNFGEITRLWSDLKRSSLR